MKKYLFATAMFLLGILVVGQPAQARTMSWSSFFSTLLESNRAVISGATSSLACQSFDQDLQLGMRSPDVKRLQLFLQASGYYPRYAFAGTYFGRLTLRSIKRFQAANGLPVTGIVDTATRAKIMGLCRIALSSISPTSGPVGTHIVIKGLGFSSTINKIYFNDKLAASVASSDGTTLEFPLPREVESSCQWFCWFPERQAWPAGDYEVYVINAAGVKSNSLDFEITQPLVITTTSLPSATVGVPYQASIAAVGGSDVYLWSADGGLPPGLTLGTELCPEAPCQASAVLSGVPTRAGDYEFTAKVISDTEIAVAHFMMTVHGPMTPTPTPTITPTPLPTTPSLSTLRPYAGPIGMEVEIIGSGFTPSDNTIHFGYGAIVGAISDGHILRFTVPAVLTPACYQSIPRCLLPSRQTAPGTYDIFVTNAYGESNHLTFRVTATITPLPTLTPTPTPTPIVSKPHILGLLNNSGQVNDQITILGSGFTRSNNYIILSNGYVATPSGSADGSMLTFLVPPQTIVPACPPLPNTACIAQVSYSSALTPGTYYLSVSNVNGQSNIVPFTVR